MKHLKIPAVIAIVAIFFALSFFFFHDIRPTMLLQTFSIESQPKVFWDEILPKKPFVFNFVAGEDNLGIVEARFRSYKRQDRYALLFQLRELGKTATLYEHIYYLFPFEQERLFPFGFPVISNSRGKHYEVTISSIGNKDIPVVVSHVYPSVTAKYYVPITQLKTQGIHAIVTFVYKKVINTITNWQFIMNAVFFLCPLGFFLYRFVFKMKDAESIMLTFITNVILFSSLGIMVVISGYSLVYVIVCFLFARYIFDWPYEIPLISILLCMGWSVTALFIGKLMIAEQFSIWMLPTGICYLLYVLFDKGKSSGKTSIHEVNIHPIGVALFVTIIGIGLVYSGYKSITAILYVKPSDKPTISYMGPTMLHNASYALIRGSGFGSEYTGEIRVMSTFGEIEESSWTDNAIVFRIPLEWTVGEFSVWMEKKIDVGWIKIADSEYSLKLLDKNKPWTNEDDDYYEQVVHGPDELRKASEYSMGWYY